MMSFETFFLNVVGWADLIASDDDLARTWIKGETGITSAFCYEELAQQVLGDMDIEKESIGFSKELKEVNAFELIREFNCRFSDVDDSLRKGRAVGSTGFADPRKLLASREWATLREAARALTKLPAAQGYLRASRNP